jgi:hypothetical protein
MRVWSMHELQVYQRCANKYKYYVRDNWEPMVSSEIIQLGSYVHEILAQYYRDNPEPTVKIDLLNPARSLNPLWMQAADIFRFYQKVADDRSTFTKILSVEDPFVVPLDAENALSFRPDLMFTIGEDYLVIRDHKTIDRIPKEGERADDELDTQVNSYLWGAHRLYPKMKIVFEYNMIRRDLPKAPAITQDGLISRSKIISTKSLYEAALKENNQWPPTPEYKKILETLPSERDYFKRITLWRTPKQLHFFENELLAMVRAARMHEEIGVFPRTVIKTGGEQCQSCPFFNICMGELLQGKQSDETTMRLLGFRQREKKNAATDSSVPSE